MRLKFTLLNLLSARIAQREVIPPAIVAVDQLNALLADLDDGLDLNEENAATLLIVGTHLLVATSNEIVVRDLAAILVTKGLAVAIMDVVSAPMVEVGLAHRNDDLNLLKELLLLANLNLLIATVRTVNVEDNLLLDELKVDLGVDLFAVVAVDKVPLAALLVVPLGEVECVGVREE